LLIPRHAIRHLSEGRNYGLGMDAECTRMGCHGKATVLLAFDPRRATAWLRDLVDAHPSLGLSLCDRHAARTSVPMGWTRVDERRPASFDVGEPFEDPFGDASSTETRTSTLATGTADDARSAERFDAPARGQDLVDNRTIAQDQAIGAAPELPFDEPSPKWREELDEWRDELARQRRENERSAASLAAATTNPAADSASTDAIDDLHEERDTADGPAGQAHESSSTSENAAAVVDTNDGDPQTDVTEDRSTSGAYKAGEIRDLSFEEIFPSLAPTGDEGPDGEAPTDAGPRPLQSDKDRSGSVPSDKPVATFRPSADPVIVEPADATSDAESEVSSSPTVSPPAAPATGGPMESGRKISSEPVAPRPSYLPSRSGSSTTFSVDASSPLLGRAFGFRPRP